MVTAEEECGKGPRPEQFDGANGARSKHSVLARREYELLASEATEGGPDNVGAACGKDGHGSLSNWEGTET